MLIGGEDISNGAITLGTCFLMLVCIRARFRFVLIGGNLTAQSKGSHRGIEGGIQIPETRRALESLLAGYLIDNIKYANVTFAKYSFHVRLCLLLPDSIHV